MSGVYQFDQYMAHAKESLEDGSTDSALDWVNQALSVSKHLEDEPVARAHLLKARILVAEEEFRHAEEAIQKSLDLFRRNVEAHMLLGELMVMDGRNEAATAALESALDISPDNCHASSLLIFCHGLRGQYDLAGNAFERCIQLDPEVADSYYYMGVASLCQGKPEARGLFEKALSKNPVLSGPHYYLGRIMMRENDLAGAQAEFFKELELNPANSLAELELIHAYLHNLPWQEAAELFEKHFPPEVFCEIPVLHGCHFHFNYELLEDRFRSFMKAIEKELPQTPENLLRVARISRYKSLFGEAAELLKKVIEADRSLRPAYAELAEIYALQDERGRACEVLEEAAGMFGDAEAHCALGRGLLACGRYAEAEQAVRKAVFLEEKLAESHFLLGVILADRASRTRDPKPLMDEARASLLRALEMDPNHAAARTYLMEVAFQEGKYEECLELAETTLNDNPQHRLALSYSGRSLQALGNLTGAEERLLKLLDFSPDDSAARATLAQVYRDQERFPEAVEQLEQAVTVPGKRPQPELLLRLGETYLNNLDQPAKAREYLIRFLQSAPSGHPEFDRAKELLGRI